MLGHIFSRVQSSFATKLTVAIHDAFSKASKSDPIFGIAVDTIVLYHINEIICHPLLTLDQNFPYHETGHTCQLQQEIVIETG